MRIVINGGLGNQMFQYALYLALKDRGRKVKLDLSLYSYLKMHNGYELEKCFGIKKLDEKFSKWHLLKLRIVLKSKLKPIVYVDFQYFNPKVFNTTSKYLHGYWQSEKYFIQIENQIRQAFVFKGIDTLNAEIAAEIANNVSIALHVRRGDYLGNSIYSGVCTEDYYRTAIQLILSKISVNENIMFYVFSDDMEFSEKFIEKFKITYKLININNGADSYKDMYLMSKCTHNIIANSSFSWWGAWLNDNPEKVIIAPQNWFNSLENNYQDIIPDNWIKL